MEWHINRSKEKEVNSLILKKSLIVSLVMSVFLLFGAGFSLPLALNSGIVGVGVAEASDAAHGAVVEETEDKGGTQPAPWAKPIGAALALIGGAMGTAMAQMKIGGAGAGAIAEKPETATMFIVMIAIPETIVILSFVIAAMIIMF
jgi:V/A-type H+-transporting ATPase subunit K